MKPQVGDTIYLSIYSRLCCDECNDPIGYYIDCPCCGETYTEATHTGEDNEIVICLNCNASFEKIEELCAGDYKVSVIGTGGGSHL